MTENNNSNYNIMQPLLLSIILIIGMVLGYKMNDADNPPLIQGIGTEESEAITGSGRVEEIIRFVDTRYVDDVDDAELVESAIATVLDQLDPHSVYIAPEYMKSINDSMEGSFRGIGIESFYLDDTVNIIGVIKDSPADKAGLKQFDQIIAINDSIVAGRGLDFSTISEMLRSDNEEKELTINKHLSKTNEKTTISIGDIPLKSVEISYMVNKSTGLIKVDRFSSKTYTEFMEALEELYENQGLKNLIIDLRGNPGGYLPETTNILSQLIREKDKLLVYTEGKANDRINYRTTGKSFFNIDKIAVLIDENSASGSEILAGAIQDWDRGLIVGRRTFGKGLVQEQYPLSNGGAIRLTVARYYTPTGRSIQEPYDNLQEYHDVSRRYKNDTLTIVDSLKYYTKMLNREVYAAGGIFPDVYIPISQIDEDPGLVDILNKVPEWVYIQLRDNVINNEISKNNMPDWEVSSSLNEKFDDYIKSINGKDVIGYLTLNNEDVNQAIKESVATMLFGDEIANKIRNERDNAMDEALKYTSSDKSLEDYLITTESK